MYGSKSNLSILKLYFVCSSSIAKVSPGQSGLSNSSNAITAPLGILGMKFSNAILVGSYKSKSKNNKDTNKWGLSFMNFGIVSTALPLIRDTLFMCPSGLVLS